MIALALVASACGGSITTASSAGTPAPATESTAPPTSAAPTTAAPSTATPTTSPSALPAYQPGRHQLSMQVDGTERTAVIVVPDDLSHPAPLVVAFHGHGGSGANFESKMQVEKLWPEAIVVYPDGLVGHKGKTDPDGVKPGWQTMPGEDGDRDLHFYDALMADVHKNLPVDNDRIYVMGHSNGSAFTSLLLNVRGQDIAATANMSAQPGRLLDTDPVRSMFMSMGKKDPIVPYDNQKQSIPIAEQKLQIDPSTATVDGYLTTEHGPGNHELDTYVHPEGHEVPDAVPPLVIAFFQRHTLAGG